MLSPQVINEIWKQCQSNWSVQNQAIAVDKHTLLQYVSSLALNRQGLLSASAIPEIELTAEQILDLTVAIDNAIVQGG